MISDMPVIAPGSAVHGGSPDTRPVKSATRWSHEMRPARCAIATQITSAVAAVAAAVPQITSPIGAPLAGSLEAAKVSNVFMTLPRSLSRLPCGYLTRIDDTLNLATHRLRRATGR